MDKKRNMVKYKLVLVIAIMLLATTAVPFVSAEPFVKAEKQMKDSLAQQQKYIKFTERINNFMERLDNEDVKGLHDIVMLVWAFIAIFIGHNIVSLLLARLFCCWFVFPIVVISNIVNINLSSGKLMSYFQSYLVYFEVDNIIYTFGALSLFILPIVYTLAFTFALIDVIQDGVGFEGGVIGNIIDDLNYIYEPDVNESEYIAPYTDSAFQRYTMYFDFKNYVYTTGLAGCTLIPFILAFFVVGNTVDKIQQNLGLE
jgi:hypothetical protein